MIELDKHKQCSTKYIGGAVHKRKKIKPIYYYYLIAKCIALNINNLNNQAK
jgi:hypothetical protein